MQRLKVVVLALMAVFALSAFASSTAFGADAEVLPTASLAYTGTSGPGTLRTVGGKEVLCVSDTSSGNLAGRTVSVHIDFSTCKGEGGLVTCTGLGEASGVILVLGSGLLVYDSLSPLGVAILVTLTPVHFSCSIVLVEVTGKVLCLVTPVGTSTKHGEIKCEMTTATSGVPKETDYFEGGVTLKTVSLAEGLLTAFNHGTPEQSAELTSALILTASNFTLDG
jgi:hypothetical protein